MRLVIVSATPMYGGYSREPAEVYEPTLREIESICDLFEEVTWLGYFKGSNPGNARRPSTTNIRLVSLPLAEGGNTFLRKLRIVPLLPALVFRVFLAVRRYDVIHTRGPSVPAFVCILLSFFLRKKIFWHKYAGNWMEPQPPFMYKVQKWLLLLATHTRVTINGTWPDQPAHVVSLENPSFTAEEREQAIRTSGQKKFKIPLTLCFAGLIDSSKGAQAFIRALDHLEQPERYIEKLILVGSGPGMEEVRKLAQNISVPVEFTGYIRRERLNEIYKKCHALLLPSRTEGFPKVVAEAAAFGCISVVTDVSSVSQYVQDGSNGYLLNDARPETIARVLVKLLHSTDLAKLSEAAKSMSSLFTYERFRDNIEAKVLRR